MKKFFVALLCLILVFDSPVFAGKSYSSGSRSSSSGRSFSSGSSRSSGRSYSSGSSSRPSSSSRSYSPSSSSRSSSSSSRSYSPSSSSKSYSSTPKSSPSKSYTPSYTPSSKPTGKSYSSGSGNSGKSYTPSYTPNKPTPAPVASSPSGRNYSGGTSVPPNAGGSSTSGQPPPKGKPTGSTFNSGMSTAAKKEESRQKYQAATAPKPSYTPPGPSGKSQPVKADSPHVQTVRRTVTHERYVTYDNRASVFYGGYYGHPVYYNDPFSPFLWGWIMSDAINSHQRALWMYHHQYDMDSARYQAMLAKDAQLQAEINALKAQNLARDPNYVPPQMQENPDVMYSKEFVDASYNPVAVAEPSPSSGSIFWGAMKTVFWTLVAFSLVGVVIYFLFVKEY